MWAIIQLRTLLQGRGMWLNHKQQVVTRHTKGMGLPWRLNVKPTEVAEQIFLPTCLRFTFASLCAANVEWLGTFQDCGLPWPILVMSYVLCCRWQARGGAFWQDYVKNLQTLLQPQHGFHWSGITNFVYKCRFILTNGINFYNYQYTSIFLKLTTMFSTAF